MKDRLEQKRSFVSIIVALSMALSMTFMPGLAAAGDTSIEAGSSPMFSTPEWAIDHGENQPSVALEAQALPSKLDLRELGVVTPVKQQGPFGSCWAFGGIAAAETSILSDAGTTYKATGLDLSERHLAYFALRPITATTNSAQVGEGVHMIGDSRNEPFIHGGSPMFITSLFSQGVGPLPESSFPYRGIDENGESHTNVQYFAEHPDEAALDQMKTEATQGGITVDQLVEILASNPAITGQWPDLPPAQAVLEFYKQFLTANIGKQVVYAKWEDWSIPETNDDGSSNRLLSAGLVLKDGNILASYWNEAKTDNTEGVAAVKRELLDGRGVSIMYCADQSGKYSISSSATSDLTAQYIYDSGVQQNHAVCIVGYDDTFDRNKFKHNVYKLADPSKPYSAANYLIENGEPVIDEAATAATVPSHDGAWIVKNSWGSQSDAGPDELGNVVNEDEYGTKNSEGECTGYFYLSYDDKTISNTESLVFSSDLGWNRGFYTLAHDYMPIVTGVYTPVKSENVVSSANVFTVGDEVDLKSISTFTTEPNMRVTFAVYFLDDGDQDPVVEGKMKYQTSINFENAGFHRFDLENDLRLPAGQRFSVVSTTSQESADGKLVYSASANKGITREHAEEKGLPWYTQAVVNEGESFLYSNGQWTDWSVHLAAANVEDPVDNFSIKAYTEPTDTSPLKHVPAVAATCTKAGNIDYWYDAATGKYYRDAAGDDEITQAETVVAALGHVWDEGEITKAPTATEPGERTFTCTRCGETKVEAVPATGITYACAEGDGATWTKGSKDALVFKFERSEENDKALDHFKGIKVNDEVVPGSNFSVTSGSVVVELNAAYLETLAAGDYKLTALFDDGAADAAFTVKGANATKGTGSGAKATSAKTGDALVPLAVVALVGCAVLVVVVYARRRMRE